MSCKTHRHNNRKGIFFNKNPQKTYERNLSGIYVVEKKFVKFIVTKSAKFAIIARDTMPSIIACFVPSPSLASVFSPGLVLTFFYISIATERVEDASREFVVVSGHRTSSKRNFFVHSLRSILQWFVSAYLVDASD
jgi:hypothetical protein